VPLLLRSVTGVTNSGDYVPLTRDMAPAAARARAHPLAEYDSQLMPNIDPERERQRLAESYSRETDEELEQVASRAYELIDIARDVLRAELTKRGLSAELTEHPSGSEVEQRKMVTIRRFRDLPEALLAKGSLESAGIECELIDDNLVRLDWFWSNGVGGVKLQVSPDDADSANEILNQPIPESFDVEGMGNYEQPRCPKCGSVNITFEELDKPVAYVTAYVGVPIPWRHPLWRCYHCDARWEDDGKPDTTESSA
jgi:hypothetical protein